MKRNNAVFGLVIGLILPLAGVFIVYFILFRAFTFDAYLNRLTADGQIAAKVLTLSILMNLLPFMLYTNRRLDRTGRGIFIGTMLYVVLIVLLKFVW